jgi:hypothetical protein
MAAYCAQLSGDIVVRVIVAPSRQWCIDTFGGTWTETIDPYAPDAVRAGYIGPGYAVQLWTAGSYGSGARVRYGGKVWVSTRNNNTSEPGTDSNWVGP